MDRQAALQAYIRALLPEREAALYQRARRKARVAAGGMSPEEEAEYLESKAFAGLLHKTCRGDRTYQLLAQVSGRAGRADKPGEVFIQTFSPDAPAVRAAADGSTYARFADAELVARREGMYPPYCHLSTLVFRARDERVADRWANLYARSLAAYAEKYNASRGGSFLVSEAVPAALAKADGTFETAMK